MPVTQKSLLAVNDPQMYVAAYLAINSKKTYSSTTHIVSPAIYTFMFTLNQFQEGLLLHLATINTTHPDVSCIGGGGQVMFCSMGLWALINSYDMTVHARMATKHSKNTSVYSIPKVYEMSLG